MGSIVLVSSCLLGIPCKYSGKSSRHGLDEDAIKRLDLTVVPVCPEQLGGLSTPRLPAEIRGGDGFDVLDGLARVVNQDGQDVTEQFVRGAHEVVRIAQITHASAMITERKSPSCSCSGIYDGTFSRNLVDGLGVTAALLRRETSLRLMTVDMLGAIAPCTDAPEESTDIATEAHRRELFRDILTDVLSVYRSQEGWEGRVQRSAGEIARALIQNLVNRSEWELVARSEFKRALPGICTGVADSDTVRFFREVFRKALDIEILEPGRHCRICTYPEGFLDTYLDETGICSACRAYQANKAQLEDRENLRGILRRKLAEVSGRYKHDAILAFSGGKDSVYTLTKLAGQYNVKLLCVMDDLSQQTEQAMDNARRAVQATGADFRILGVPACEREIRRNFLRAGESFCRLCLRSHFIRLYEVALAEKIPLIFFGLSPYQCLDCPDAIQWSLNAINDVATPLDRTDYKAVLRRYKHRAFQGGFDRGFVTPPERDLLLQWTDVFDQAKADFAPLIVPFFLFDGYPDETEIMETITREVGWERPETVLLRRTNCRWLRPAGILHQAIGKYHLNYKERAAALRLQNQPVSEEEARSLIRVLNNSVAEEWMSPGEFEQFLRDEFALRISDLPDRLQAQLEKILKANETE